MSEVDEALKIWDALKPMVDRQIESQTRTCVRARKMSITTAPNGTTVGVTRPYDSEIFVPYSSSLDTAQVGDTAWVWYYMNNASTMIACATGAGQVESPFITTNKIADGAITTVKVANDAITSVKIADNSISTPKLVAGSVTTDILNAGSVTTDKLAAASITASKIDTTDLDAINATLGTATIAQAEIAVADISYLQVKDANVTNLIARDAITDKYFIDKLAVRNAQMVYATVGELVIKASDNKYYRLDVNSNGSLTPTEVTLTAGEITAGVTSDGHASIIETDLTVADLSASNMKGITALIDTITASRIDVDELFARTATIQQLNAYDIRGNQYLRLAVNRVYPQFTDPALTASNNVQDGDIWQKTTGIYKWSDFGTLKWSDLSGYTWGSFGEGVQYVRRNGAWEMINDPNSKYSIVSGIEIFEPGVEISGRKYVRIKSGGSFLVDSGNFSIDENGNVTMTGTVKASSGQIGGWTIGSDKLSSGNGTTYVQMAVSGDYAFLAGNATESSAPFRVKRDGTVYLKQLITVNEQGAETTVDLQNYPFWKLYYHTIKSYTASSITLSNGAVINFNSAAQTYLDSEWDGNEFNYYVKDQDDQVILSGSITLTPTPPQTGTGPGGSPLTNFNAQHKMAITVTATGVSGPLFYWLVDATGEYQSGYDAGELNVTVTDIGQTTQASYANQNYTVHARASASNGRYRDKDLTVDASAAFKDGNNTAYANQTVVGTCYIITAHSGDWVKVQEVGTGYSRVPYMN